MSTSSDLVSDKKWTELDAAQHRAHAMRLLDGLEVIAREKRLKVARAILYMAQGQSTSLKTGLAWINFVENEILPWEELIEEGIFGFICIFHSGEFCFSPGTFAECSSEAEVQYWMRYNIFLLLDVGTFSALVELLNMEIEYVLHQFSTQPKSLESDFCHKMWYY